MHTPKTQTESYPKLEQSVSVQQTPTHTIQPPFPPLTPARALLTLYTVGAKLGPACFARSVTPAYGKPRKSKV